MKSLDADSTAVAQGDHSCGTNLESRNQKLEQKERVYQPASSMTPREEGLAGLNGSADPMISDIVGWMTGGDRQSAKNWLSTFLGQYAQEGVRESYLDLKTQIAEGKIISRPLMVWSRIAARMKTQRPAANAAPIQSESKRERKSKQFQLAVNCSLRKRKQWQQQRRLQSPKSSSKRLAPKE